MVTLFNITRNRKATKNEIAKKLILDQIQNIIVDEKMEAEGMSEKEVEELREHLAKHVSSITKKLNPNYETITYKF